MKDKENLHQFPPLRKDIKKKTEVIVLSAKPEKNPRLH